MDEVDHVKECCQQRSNETSYNKHTTAPRKYNFPVIPSVRWNLESIWVQTCKTSRSNICYVLLKIRRALPHLEDLQWQLSTLSLIMSQKCLKCEERADLKNVLCHGNTILMTSWSYGQELLNNSANRKQMSNLLTWSLQSSINFLD